VLVPQEAEAESVESLVARTLDQGQAAPLRSRLGELLGPLALRLTSQRGRCHRLRNLRVAPSWLAVSAVKGRVSVNRTTIGRILEVNVEVP
jgi:hypothetical protein